MLSKALATGIGIAASSLPLAAAPIEPPAIVRTVGQVSLKELSDKLFEAGGASLNRTAAGLEIMSTPKRWLDAGCDLETDILQTVKARAARMQPHSISSWKFFDAAVFDAKAARTAPIPAGRVNFPPQDRQKSVETAMLDRMWAEAVRKGEVSE